jgi:lysophospholipase L1-like esterase
LMRRTMLIAVPLLLAGCVSAATEEPDRLTEEPQATEEIVTDSPTLETTTMPETLDCAHEREIAARFLALGDSYTIGERVDEAERWPVQLVRLLQEGGAPIDPPEIIARTGWTTSELNTAIDAANPQGPYDLVSLLIGVNNQYRGYSQDEYRTEFEALLKRAIGFAGGNVDGVLVLSIPDWGVTPFGINSGRADISAEIDAFNAINREVSEALGVRYVDITPESREAVTDPTLIAGDGLHPSGKMYAAWARMAFDEACASLRNE